jgi:hypothetical protein
MRFPVSPEASVQPLTHPAGLEDEPVFYGVECEGALSGEPTAFVRRGLSDEETVALVRRIKSDGITQVFLTETFFEWDWLAVILFRWLAENAPTMTVTIGRHAKDMPEFVLLPFRDKLKVIVRFLDCPWMTQLGSDDEISVGVPYNLTTFRVGAGVETLPQEYERDTR